MKRALILAALALVACGNQPAGNVMNNAAVTEGPTPANSPSAAGVLVQQGCDLPKLDFRAAKTLSAKDRARFTANFRSAFEKACAEGLMADGPLVDEDAHVKDTIFVMNAPEANVTSIYFGPSAAPPAMLLESPFGNPPQIPSAEDLHEAIYCAVKGATPEEEETTGRCLPD